MREITRNLRQDAIYWPPNAPDGFGTVTFGAPVAIKCRWENKKTLFRDAQGREVMSEAIVYTDRIVEIQGFLALDGALTDNPKEVGLEIRQYGQTVSLRARKRLNKVWL